MVQRIFATPPESESIPNSEAASLHERSPRPPGAVEKPAPGTKPRDALEEQLIRIWRSILPKERVGIHDDFFHLGGHSLLAARIFAEIERTLQVRLPLATLLQNPTVAKLSALIRQGPNAAHWRALVPISAAGSRRPLFLVHGLGGNILSYQPLARFLDRHQPVYGLQAIGLNGLTPPLTTVESMAARYAQQIVEAYPSGPYHLGGMSMGGIIAYEIAQQFQRAGREVGLVLLLDSIPAQPVALLPRRNRLQHQLRTATARIHRQVTEAFRTPAQRWPELIRHKARLAWRLAHDYPDRSDLARNNLAAFRRYSPTRYPGNITLVNAQTHHRADKDLFRAAWGQLASSLSYHEVPGDHVSFMEEPHVKHTAEVVRDCLNADAHHRQNPVSSSVA